MSVEVSIEAVLAHCTREGLEALIARKVRSGEAPTREELVQLAGEPETGSVQTGTEHLSKTDDFRPTFLRGNDFKPDADLTFSEVSVSADGFKRVGVLNERDRQRGASLPPYTSDARFPGRGVPLGPMSKSCKSGTQWLLCSPLMLVCGAKYSEDTSRCHCDLQCPQGCGEGREFLAAIQAFESCIKRAAATYSQEWFNTSSLWRCAALSKAARVTTQAHGDFEFTFASRKRVLNASCTPMSSAHSSLRKMLTARRLSCPSSRRARASKEQSCAVKASTFGRADSGALGYSSRRL